MQTFINDKILENVKNIEKDLYSHKETIIHYPFIKEIRICGSLFGMEFVTREKCDQIFHRFMENGLLVKQGGRDYRTLIFWCMLNLKSSQINEIFNIINMSLK